MEQQIKIDTEKFRVKEKISLKDFNTKEDGGLTKEEGKILLSQNKEKMSLLQERLYAEDEQGLVIVFQAMDAAGKDGCVKHVMSGLNPAATKVTSFKAPSGKELDHDYLWRINLALPARGEIGIFNRSHYEEVVVVRLHNLVKGWPIPDRVIEKDIWEDRFKQIRDWEDYLSHQGIQMVKFFLHISKEEQRERLLDRIYEEDKNWKFSSGDILEREHWDSYQKLYEEAINETSTKRCPWYVVGADRKWFSRALVSQVVLETLEKMDPKIPELSKEEKESLSHWKDILENDI